jgi:drug/metabolite transporter (DMT)-like permease
MLVALALIWGASFMFIKVAVRELAPATLILGRLGLAAITLALVVPFTVGAREAAAQIRAHARWLVVIALINMTVPFWLLSWGETRIDSGLASIIQASVPIFNVLIAFGFFHEVRVRGIRLVGVAIGFVGIALLVGAQPHGKMLGALAVVGMALCYAIAGLLTGRHLRPVPPVVVAFATTAVAAVVVLPAGVAQAPSHAPGWKVTGSVIALAIPGTAVAFLLSFALIAGAGALFASFVTYLIPPIALIYGAVFLGESVTSISVGGLLLVLLGVGLGTGTLRPSHLRRRSLASET